MGQAKKKKDRFFKQHPYCCFCGGINLATTIDHIPNRACFRGRHAPEGYEFPACAHCQQFLRKEEQVFALMVRGLDHNDENSDPEQLEKQLQGFVNNTPHLFPNMSLSANEKRHAIERLGHKKPDGCTYSDLPIARYPKEINPYIQKVLIKLGLALYYYHTEKSAELESTCYTNWTHVSDKNAVEAFLNFASSLVNFEKGKRQNVNINDQFQYMWDLKEGSPTWVFVAVVQFGRGLVGLCIIGSSNLKQLEEMKEDIMTVEDWNDRKQT